MSLKDKKETPGLKHGCRLWEVMKSLIRARSSVPEDYSSYSPGVKNNTMASLELFILFMLRSPCRSSCCAELLLHRCRPAGCKIHRNYLLFLCLEEQKLKGLLSRCCIDQQVSVLIAALSRLLWEDLVKVWRRRIFWKWSSDAPWAREIQWIGVSGPDSLRAERWMILVALIVNQSASCPSWLEERLQDVHAELSEPETSPISTFIPTFLKH